MLVRVLSGIFFTEAGVKERYLGYLNLLGIPWNLKFLWAPLVDAYSSKKSWQVGVQIAIGVMTIAIGVLCYLGASAADTAWYLQAVAISFVVLAFLSATNDIAIDGFYLEALPDRDEQALLSGYRVLAYRLAVVFARSGLVALAAYLTAKLSANSPFAPWGMTFCVAGCVMIALALYHLRILPRHEPSSLSEEGISSLRRAFIAFECGFKSYLAQDKIALILAFVVLYKMGDEILFSMVTPFMLREIKITTAQYAWLGGIVGAFASVVGAIVGGWWIKRVGLRKAIWPLTLIMNLNIWLYVWLAYSPPDPSTINGTSLVAVVHAIEQIAAGVGSAVLLVFLLSTCSDRSRATHYAIGSAIMSIPGTLIGSYAGKIVEGQGYLVLYIGAFLASIPGMLLIPFVPLAGRRDVPLERQ